MAALGYLNEITQRLRKDDSCLTELCLHAYTSSSSNNNNNNGNDDDEEVRIDQNNDARKIIDGDLICNTISQALTVNTTLLSLDLSSSRITDQGCCAIANIFSSHAKRSPLIELNLNGNQIGDNGVLVLVEALLGHETLHYPQLPSLEKLFLFRNRIGNVGVQYLAHVLHYHPRRSNNNSNNDDDNNDDDNHTSLLTTLNIGHNPIGIEGYRAIFEKSFDRVQDVDNHNKSRVSSQNDDKISSGSVSNISKNSNIDNKDKTNYCAETKQEQQRRRRRRQLNELRLGGTMMMGIEHGGSGRLADERYCQIMARAFNALNHIKILDLSDNSIGDYGTIIVSQILQCASSCCIQELVLWGNGITFLGCHAIAQALKINDTVEKLDLDTNLIGNGGCMALAETLYTNKTLVTLSIEQNGIIHPTQTRLEEEEQDDEDDDDNEEGHHPMNPFTQGLGRDQGRCLESLFEAICESETTVLQCLNIGWNPIGDMACRAMGQVILNHNNSNNIAHSHATTHKSPKCLDLSLCHTQIGCQGCILLANILEYPTTLTMTKLSLCNNSKIDNNCCQMLASALRQNTILKELYITNCCNITPSVVYPLLVQLLRDYNETLTVVNLDSDDDDNTNERSGDNNTGLTVQRNNNRMKQILQYYCRLNQSHLRFFVKRYYDNEQKSIPNTKTTTITALSNHTKNNNNNQNDEESKYSDDNNNNDDKQKEYINRLVAERHILDHVYFLLSMNPSIMC